MAFEFAKLKTFLSTKRQVTQMGKASAKLRRALGKKLKSIQNLESAIEDRRGDNIRKYSKEVAKLTRQEVSEAFDDMQRVEKILKKQLDHLKLMRDELYDLDERPNELIDAVMDERNRIKDIAEEILRSQSRIQEGGSILQAKEMLDEGSLINDLRGFALKLKKVAGRVEKTEKQEENVLHGVDELSPKVRRTLEKNLKNIEKYLDRELEYLEENSKELLILIQHVMKELREYREKIKSLIQHNGYRRSYGKEILEEFEKTTKSIEEGFDERDKELRFLIGESEH